LGKISQKARGNFTTYITFLGTMAATQTRQFVMEDAQKPASPLPGCTSLESGEILDRRQKGILNDIRWIEPGSEGTAEFSVRDDEQVVVELLQE
jgi:hypothetical protein